MADDRIELELVIHALDGQVAEAVRTVTLMATENLIRTTPVDTGWARANWIPSIGVPVEGPDGQRPEGGGQASNGSQVAGMASMVAYQPQMGPAWIANNVPYIVDLNSGTSLQAPAGFVEQSLQLAVAQANAAVRSR